METMELEVTEQDFDWSVDVYAKLTNAPVVHGRDLERYGAADRKVRVVSVRLHLSGDATRSPEDADRRVYLVARQVRKDGSLGTMDHSYQVWNYELPERPEWLRRVVEDLTTKAREMASARLAG